MSKKKIQPLNLDKPVIEMLKARADSNDRSMSAEANRILKKELSNDRSMSSMANRILEKELQA